MEVSYGPITITLRKATIRDGWLREHLSARLQELYEGAANYVIAAIPSFATVVSQIASAQQLPFATVSDTDTDEALRAAFEDWLGQDEAFGDLCWRAIIDLRRPVDRATAPGKLPKDASPE